MDNIYYSPLIREAGVYGLYLNGLNPRITQFSKTNKYRFVFDFETEELPGLKEPFDSAKRGGQLISVAIGNWFLPSDKMSNATIKFYDLLLGMATQAGKETEFTALPRGDVKEFINQFIQLMQNVKLFYCVAEEQVYYKESKNNDKIYRKVSFCTPWKGTFAKAKPEHLSQTDDLGNLTDAARDQLKAEFDPSRAWGNQQALHERYLQQENAWRTQQSGQNNSLSHTETPSTPNQSAMTSGLPDLHNMQRVTEQLPTKAEDSFFEPIITAAMDMADDDLPF